MRFFFIHYSPLIHSIIPCFRELGGIKYPPSGMKWYEMRISYVITHEAPSRRAATHYQS